jgi:DNA end-binding protein Ku
MATMLIDKKTGKFDAGEFHDRYIDALKDLIERKKKAKGGKVVLDTDDAKPSRGSNVVDLMAALKKSLGPGGAPKSANDDKPAAKAPAKKPAAKTAAKTAVEKPAAKAPAKPAAARKRA